MELFGNWKQLIRGFDDRIEAAMQWTGTHGAGVFGLLRALLEGGYGAIHWGLSTPPWWAVAIVLGLLGWRQIGPVFGLLSAAALALCWALGLWTETVQTMGLVFSATTMAVVVGGAIGVAAGYSPQLARFLDPALDLIQTMPPYIYLLPSIAFLGYGPATAVLATFIVAVPPMVKLTTLGIRETPVTFLELGAASGATDLQTFALIRLPYALPSIMAGINQSLMMAFGMVVIAGIVGSGGLGQAIYEAIRTLDIARSFDAAIAIVILTIVLDRLSQSTARKESA